MNYILKYFDKDLIKFEFLIDKRGITTVQIKEIYRKNEKFLPFSRYFC